MVGIVAKLSDCIAAKGGNILGYDVFVPENKNVFYSRRYKIKTYPLILVYEPNVFKVNIFQNYTSKFGVFLEIERFLFLGLVSD